MIPNNLCYNQNMILRGVDFGKVWCGAGVLGFVGEGYWWNALYRKFLLNHITFVSKTITADPHAGNVRLNKKFRPASIFPETLRINFFTGLVTNRFGWANPGLEAVLQTRFLQGMRKPFVLSVGSISKTQQERIDDFEKIVTLLQQETFSTPYAIQLNISCPNLDEQEKLTIENTKEIIQTLSRLGVPIQIKLGPTELLSTFVELEKAPELDGYCLTNTLPSTQGGVSGKPLFQNNLTLIQELRKAGIQKPINAGGGILSKQDAQKYLDAGANSVFIWSITLLRPWRLLSILKLKNNR